jgi:hypothetical protein
LADGPAFEVDVLEHLTEAFQRHGAPLVLKHERPRPVLNGRTAHEALVEDRLLLPDRNEFRRCVALKQQELLAQATSRNEEQSAGRRGVGQVLLIYGLLEIQGDLSTDFQVENPTD